jgi:hypothetical protein
MVVLCLALKLAHYPMPIKQIGNGSQNTHNRVAIRQFPELFLRNLSQETISRIRAKEKMADWEKISNIDHWLQPTNKTGCQFKQPYHQR